MARYWQIINLLNEADREVTSERRLLMLERRKELRAEVLEYIPDWQFQSMYRFTRSEFVDLCGTLRSRTTLRGTETISLELKVWNNESVQVLTALMFLTMGSYQKSVALAAMMDQRTVSTCLKEVVQALNHSRVIGEYVVFPTTPMAKEQVKAGFYDKFGFPEVLGAIDCTHIALVRPAEDEHCFFNRKHFHSLNVQMVCDSDLRFLSVNPKFGGATNDHAIWGLSRIKEHMENLYRVGESTWLLGDSGYPQRAYLMIPILHAAPGSMEESYTKLHLKTRNTIERAFGVLKNRFRCLLGQRVLYYHPDYVAEIVKACCVLHNMLIISRGPPDEDDEHDADQRVPHLDYVEDNESPELVVGRAVRARLIQRLFS